MRDQYNIGVAAVGFLDAGVPKASVHNIDARVKRLIEQEQTNG